MSEILKKKKSRNEKLFTFIKKYSSNIENYRQRMLPHQKYFTEQKNLIQNFRIHPLYPDEDIMIDKKTQKLSCTVPQNSVEEIHALSPSFIPSFLHIIHIEHCWNAEKLHPTLFWVHHVLFLIYISNFNW